MNPSEGTTDNGHTYRVEWENHRPTLIVIDGAEQEFTSLKRYRGSGVYLKCVLGTLRLAQIPGKPCTWTPS